MRKKKKSQAYHTFLAVHRHINYQLLTHNSQNPSNLWIPLLWDVPNICINLMEFQIPGEKKNQTAHPLFEAVSELNSRIA